MFVLLFVLFFADFLQKHGLERTALQRKQEVIFAFFVIAWSASVPLSYRCGVQTEDIDLDFNGRIAFIEYLLLHYSM